MNPASPQSAAMAVAAPVQSSTAGRARLLVVTLVVVALAEMVGAVQFKLGPGKVVLLPMLWALLIAAAFGLA